MHAKERIESVDTLRGLIMIIMALDHVREFWSVTPFRPEDLLQTTSALFFTRWITHFCAPVFVFLSGISIFFISQRKSVPDLSKFLIKRGLWLILLQVFVLSFFMQFSYNLIILEVIWVLGWSMILMSGLIWLPRWLIATVVLIIIAGHNLIPDIQSVNPGNIIPVLLHNSPKALVLSGFPVIVIAYTIFPWVAVMAGGYVIGSWFTLAGKQRNKLLAGTGAILLLLFIIIRYINIYGDSAPWYVQERGDWFTVLSFLNVSKYPPSLLFLLMTLGVACFLLSVLEKTSGKVTLVIRTFGKVPFFFYLLHIPLIVLGAYIWVYLSSGIIVSLAFAPKEQWPEMYHPSLLRTYLVWIIYIVILYFPCRWFGRYKSTNNQWWLSYL